MEDSKASKVFGLSLYDKNLAHVRDAQSTKQMWSAIQNAFECHTLLSKLGARRKFYTVTRENGERMLTSTNRVKQLAWVHLAMEVTVNKKGTVIAVLNGLPFRFDNVIVALNELKN